MILITSLTICATDGNKISLGYQYGYLLSATLQQQFPPAAEKFIDELLTEICLQQIEKGLRALTVDELYKMAQLFNMTTDQIINYDGKLPKEVVIEDKNAVEQMRLLQQLDDEDRQTIFKIIDKMLTTKKFKDFFQKNVAAL